MTLSGVGMEGPLQFYKIPLSDHGVHLKSLQTISPRGTCRFVNITFMFMFYSTVKYYRVNVLFKYSKPSILRVFNLPFLQIAGLIIYV